MTGTYKDEQGHLRNTGDGTRVHPPKGVTFVGFSPRKHPGNPISKTNPAGVFCPHCGKKVKNG